MDPLVIQAAAAAASLVVAVAAVWVANRANEVGQDAVKVAQGARDIARDSVDQARRLAILATVPSLTAQRPKDRGDRMFVYVVNGGPGVAYGILASIAGAGDRRLDAIDESSRRASGRQVSLTAGPNAERLSVPTTIGTSYPWIHVRLEYMSPLGAMVRQDYLGPSDPQSLRYRLHRVTVTVDGLELLRFDVDLGPFDEADEGRPPIAVSS